MPHIPPSCGRPERNLYLLIRDGRQAPRNWRRAARRRMPGKSPSPGCARASVRRCVGAAEHYIRLYVMRLAFESCYARFYFRREPIIIMAMADSVTDIQALKRRKTIADFEALRSESARVVLSDHICMRRDLRLPGVTDQQLRRAVRDGEIVKVGPGKYRHWKVQVWLRTAGEVLSVVCEVCDGYLFLITCWEGRGNEPDQ